MSQIRTVLSLLEVTSFCPVLSYKVVIASTSSVCPTRVLRNSADFGCQDTSELAIPYFGIKFYKVGNYVCLEEVFEFIDAEVDDLLFAFFEEILLDLWVVVESLLNVEVIWS